MKVIVQAVQDLNERTDCTITLMDTQESDLASGFDINENRLCKRFRI